jgi:hypothetical protein
MPSRKGSYFRLTQEIDLVDIPITHLTGSEAGKKPGSAGRGAKTDPTDHTPPSTGTRAVA